MIDEIETRIVTLSGGPYDGGHTVASHTSAIHGENELYVQMSSEEPNTFFHAMTEREKLKEPLIEQKIVEWARDNERRAEAGEFPSPPSVLIPLSWFKIGLYYELYRGGFIS